MKDVALIFPGQGAQYVGMGKNFYDENEAAREVFDEAEREMQNGLLETMFAGPSEQLTSTAYCQPAILTMSAAALTAFQQHEMFTKIRPRFAAGLSLGEYTALMANGAITFSDALQLVRHRAKFMEEACRQQPGGMAAIIGVGKARLDEVCRQIGIEVANYNSPQQIVITGQKDKVKEACGVLESEAKTVIPLDVGGAFHSSLMVPAREKFEEVAKSVTIRDPKFPVVSNVDGRPTANAREIQGNLAAQITSSVQWVDSIAAIASQGVGHFIEIGPGKVLKGLIRRIDKSLQVYNVECPQDISALPF